jgi:hypothetical protein
MSDMYHKICIRDNKKTNPTKIIHNDLVILSNLDLSINIPRQKRKQLMEQTLAKMVSFTIPAKSYPR